MEIRGKVCRTCLKGDTQLFPLNVKFEDQLQGKKMLEFLLGTEVLENEAFSLICDLCKTKLTVSCTFKKQCLVSEEKITEYLLGEETTNTSMDDLFVAEKGYKNSRRDPLIDNTGSRSVVPKEEDDDETFYEESFEIPPDDSIADYPQETKVKKKPSRKATKERTCNPCEITFPSMAAYMKHYGLVHKDRKMLREAKAPKLRPKDEKMRHCGRCNKKFDGINEYKNHYYHVHTKKTSVRASKTAALKMLEDQEEENTPEQLENFPKGEKPMTCRPCKKSFPDTKSYRTHYWHEHAKVQGSGIQKIVCDDCGKTVSRSRIKIHQRAHSGKTFFCSLCSTGFTMKESLTAHMRTHTREKKYVCKYCNESFIHWRTRKTHILKEHEPEKRPEAFACTMCPKKYGQKYYLEFHMRKHRGDLRHECTFCQKRFISAHALKRHLVSHTGEKNEICPVCGKGFGTPGVLRLHMVTHTGERDYVCQVCNRAFTQCHVLRSHLRSAHPEVPTPPKGAILKRNSTKTKSRLAKYSDDENEQLKYEYVENDNQQNVSEIEDE